MIEPVSHRLDCAVFDSRQQQAIIGSSLIKETVSGRNGLEYRALSIAWRLQVWQASVRRIDPGELV